MIGELPGGSTVSTISASALQSINLSPILPSDRSHRFYPVRESPGTRVVVVVVVVVVVTPSVARLATSTCVNLGGG